MSSSTIQRIGRYTILDVLGHGAMGVVYRAYDTVLERVVAVKTHHIDVNANENVRRRFAAEVKMSSRLNHPNIVTVYDGGVDTDLPFIAMELVEGTTLEAVLAKRGKLPPDEALDILVPVGEALAYAHREQIVHRDLKPANILIASNGQPKVSDFGVAKALGSAAPSSTIMIGTPTHMAPEQIEGKAIDGRVDVFSLGVVAYRTLTGRAPFPGEQLPQLIHSIMKLDPPPPSEIEPSLPRAVDAVFSRALAKSPGGRYASTDAFVHDLRDVLEAKEVTTLLLEEEEQEEEGAPPPAAKALARRSYAPLWIGAAVGMAGGLGIIFFLRSSPPPQAPLVEAGRALDIPIPHVPIAETPPQALARIEPTPAEPKPVSEAPAVAARERPVVAEPTSIPEVKPEPTPTAVPRAKPEPAPVVVPPPAAPVVAAPATRRPAATPVPRRAPTAALPASRGEDEGLAPDELVARYRPPPVQAAGLKVISQPPGAEVLVDGRVKGRTPLDLDDVEPGHHDVEVRARGYAPYRRSVELERGAHSRVEVTLLSALNSLTVESQPPGASVTVNGTSRGAAPVVIGDLESGNNDVTVELPGLPPQGRTVRVGGSSGGSHHTITFRLSAN